MILKIGSLNLNLSLGNSKKKLGILLLEVEDKDYIRHTGYPGGQRILSVKEMFDKHPERVVEKAVRGMLPKNKLGNKLYRNLRVVVGSEHDMAAQKPETLDLNTIKE